jgi:hypothetical protein
LHRIAAIIAGPGPSIASLLDRELLRQGLDEAGSEPRCRMLGIVSDADTVIAHTDNSWAR